MPLSDHEQQLLKQLEKQLRTEDPGFASNISHQQTQVGVGISAKRLVVGIIVLVLGVGVTLASIFFLALPLAAIGGVFGFAIMVAGGYAAVSGSQQGAQRSESSFPQPSAAKRTSVKKRSFMDNMEKRWEQRRGDQY